MSPNHIGALSLIGRILLSSVFWVNGVMKILNWQANANLMAEEGMPLIPLLLTCAILTEVGGGFSVLLGWKTRWAAGLLFLFLIPTTLVFHHFWTYTGEAQFDQMQHFLKNIAIMGGLAAVAAFGAGPISLDARQDTSLTRERRTSPSLARVSG